MGRANLHDKRVSKHHKLRRNKHLERLALIPEGCAPPLVPQQRNNTQVFQQQTIEDQVKKEEVDDDDDDAGWVQGDKDPDYLPDSASDKTHIEENEKVPMWDQAKKRAPLSEADKKKRQQRENERRREKKAKETPAEKEERLQRYRQREREQKKLRRSKMTPEEKQEETRKNMERKKLRYAQMTHEQREEQNRRYNERKRLQRAQMAPEERNDFRRNHNINSFFRKEAKKAALTKEELEQRKTEYAKLPEEKKEARREVNRKYFQNLSEEKRMEYQKGNFARVRQYKKKIKETNQAKWKVMQNKMKVYQRKLTAKETPEQRQKRLLRYKVYQAKRKAKLKMEEEGVPSEEIERRLAEIVRQVEEKDRLEREKKPVDTAEYKPREAARKPKKKNLPQLETLPEEEEQNDNSSNFSCALPQQPSTSLMEDSYLPTQGNDVFKEEESVVRDNPVATASVHESYSEPCSPAALAFQDDDDDHDCFSDSVPRPNTSFPVTVNLDNSKGSNASFIELVYAPETVSVQEGGHDLEDFNSVQDPVSLQKRKKNVHNEIECPSSSIIQHESANATILTSSIKVEVEALGEEVERASVPASSKKGESAQVKASEDVPPGNNTTKEKDRVICDECGKCLNRDSMRKHKHLFHKHTIIDFKCPKCENGYLTAQALWIHYLNVHEETLANSTDRGKSLKRSGRLKTEDVPAEEENPKKPRVYGLNGPFVCEECGRQYKEKANMIAHMRRVHLEQRFICEVCGKEEQTGGKLWRHKVAKHPEMDAPPPEGTVICEYCTEPILRHYQNHVKTAHPEKYEEYKLALNRSSNKGKSKCPECNKEIGTHEMRRHMRNIHGHKPKALPCQHCGKNFKENYHLQHHIRVVHTFETFDVNAMKLIKEKVDEDGKRILFCSLCDEKLFFSKHMRAHLISSHLEVYEKVKNDEVLHVSESDIPPWQCGECSENFNTEQLFYSHVHSSHPTTQYYCSQPSCHKLFKSQEVLRTHHREEHPHARFSNPLKYEGGTCRYPQIKCSHCNIKFRRKVQLLEHVKSHHPESYLLCPHCELFCDNQQRLETHVSNCRRNPEAKRIQREMRNKNATNRSKGRICETEKEWEKDHDDDEYDDSDEDNSLCIPPDEIETRRSFRIKEKKTPNKVKLLEVKTRWDKVHNNHELDKEVRVLVVRLTAKEINFYTTRK